MKGNKKLFLLTVGILGITWLIVMLLICNISSSGTTGIVSFVFGILGFVLVCALNMVPEKAHAPNDASSYVIPFVISVLYLGISCLLNTVLIVLASFVHLSYPWITTIAIILNLLLVSGFTIYALYALAYIGWLRAKDNAVRNKTAGPASISSMISASITLTENNDVRSALKKLKETVDYSTNTSSKYSQTSEGMFYEQLVDIQTAIKNEISSDEILVKVQKAMRIWQSRNVNIR